MKFFNLHKFALTLIATSITMAGAPQMSYAVTSIDKLSQILTETAWGGISYNSGTGLFKIGGNRPVRDGAGSLVNWEARTDTAPSIKELVHIIAGGEQAQDTPKTEEELQILESLVKQGTISCVSRQINCLLHQRIDSKNEIHYYNKENPELGGLIRGLQQARTMKLQEMHDRKRERIERRFANRMMALPEKIRLELAYRIWSTFSHTQEDDKLLIQMLSNIDSGIELNLPAIRRNDHVVTLAKAYVTNLQTKYLNAPQPQANREREESKGSSAY